MGIKRWLILLVVGAALLGVGVDHLLQAVRAEGLFPDPLYQFLRLHWLPLWLQILLPLLAGAVIVTLTLARLGANLLAPFRRPGERVADSLYFHTRRSRGPQVVAIGGGTGMPGLLRGLTQHTNNITAVVTVADDGGSSGRLRKELGLLPPGDFRNNIAALARDETMMTQLLQYRFGSALVQGEENGRGELRGHAFGNLLLAALTGITGSFDEALLAAERVLALRGRVLPSTLAEVTLVAEVEKVLEKEGPAVLQAVTGESAIPKAGGRIHRVRLEPAAVPVYPPVVQAILRADLILIGPGSLYTSILPNLLVSGLAIALQKARAPKIYICNLATQPGETDNYTVADHVAAIQAHTPAGCIDLVLANDNLAAAADAGGGRTIFVQPAPPDAIPMVTADLVDETRPWRHESAKVAQTALEMWATYKRQA